MDSTRARNTCPLAAESAAPAPAPPPARPSRLVKPERDENELETYNLRLAATLRQWHEDSYDLGGEA